MKRSEIPEFLEKMNASFLIQMKSLPLKRKTLEDLKAGFSDGARCTLLQLIEEGIIQVEE